MLSVRAKINTRLLNRLKLDSDAPYYGKTLDITGTRNGTPMTFPTLNIDSLGELSTADCLNNTRQNAIISTIELKAYTNIPSGGGGMTDARNLMSKAGDIMLSMGYSLIYGPDSDDSSGSYNIVTARFRRFVGGNDNL